MDSLNFKIFIYPKEDTKETKISKEELEFREIMSFDNNSPYCCPTSGDCFAMGQKLTCSEHPRESGNASQEIV